MESLPDSNQNGANTTPTDSNKLKERKKVGFTPETTPSSPDNPPHAELSGGNDAVPVDNHDSHDVSPSETLLSSPVQSRPSSFYDNQQPNRLRRSSVSEHDVKQIHMAFNQSYIPRPRPAIRKTQGSASDIELGFLPDGSRNRTSRLEHQAGVDAHKRASKLAARVGAYSDSRSRASSFDSPENDQRTTDSPSIQPTVEGNKEKPSEETDDDDVLYRRRASRQRSESRPHTEARKLIRTFTRGHQNHDADDDTPLQSGQTTPAPERDSVDYVERPKVYRGGIFGALLQLRNAGSLMEAGLGGLGTPPEVHGHSRNNSHGSTAWTEPHTPQSSPPQSGTATPRQGLLNHFHKKSGSRSPGSIAQLVGSSSTLALPPKDFADQVTERLRKHEKRPDAGKRSRSGNLLSALGIQSRQEEHTITIKIADIMIRQRYLLILCRLLMETGAPTHRLEEYMRYSARAQEIEAQFIYIPGCMIISFDDSTTHTAEVKLVRANSTIDLGKLRDVHEVYKDVLHYSLDVEEATRRLEAIMKRPRKHSPWFLVFMYGLASTTVGPFAFQARFIDLPLAFLLGSILGFLQLILAPKSDLYANVFEISASVLTSFLARALGSINDAKGQPYFCFSALAQSSIALILPGYTVLCAALELQSKQIVPGSIRLVYAILYSLFLGFGITIGTVIFGLMDKHATSATTCSNPMSQWWYFLFVPGFTLCLIIINQAKWKQVPVMMVIAAAGYVTNYFTAHQMAGNTQVSNTLGAFVIGFLANLYSRLGLRVENWLVKDIWEEHLRPAYKRFARKRYFHRNARTVRRDSMEYQPRKRRLGYGLAAAAMLPAIFVQVPSGLAVNGSLVAGITSADQILSNSTGNTVVTGNSPTNINSIAFDFGYSVVQVAIGITVGLFLAALAVYPFGKRRSSIFSF